MNGRLMLLQASSQLRVASRRPGRRSSVCISKGGKVFFGSLHLHLHGVEDIWRHGLRHFHTFLCNVGSSRVSITRGSSMYILAFNSCQLHIFIVHFIPEEGAAIDAVLIVICLQNTPYRLHKYMFRREEASKTASQLKISFVIFLGWLGYRCWREHTGLATSRVGKSFGCLYSSRMYPGGTKSMGWGPFDGRPAELDLWEDRNGVSFYGSD
jgi:hypothetical protein